ncbi:hypothetical protein PFISCL1PPCAC_16530, partial [Pristionchus fissidentatus]
MIIMESESNNQSITKWGNYSIDRGVVVRGTVSSSLELAVRDEVPLAEVAGEGGVGCSCRGCSDNGCCSIGSRHVSSAVHTGEGVQFGGGLGDQLLPEGVSLLDYLVAEGLVLVLSVEGELVGGLSSRDLVRLEPLVRCPCESGEDLLDVVHRVDVLGERVGDVNGHQLPVRFSIVNESQTTDNFHLEYGSSLVDGGSNLDDINGVVVSLGARLGVSVLVVLPRLGECSIVPDVSVVGEDVVDESGHTLLLVLLDGRQRLLRSHLHLGVAPSRNLNNHVEDLGGLIGVEGDVVPRGDVALRSLDVASVVEGVERSSLLSLVLDHGAVSRHT